MEEQIITQKTDEQREIRKKVLSLMYHQKQFKEQEKEFEEEKKEVNAIVRNFLKKRGGHKASIETDEGKIGLTLVERKTIEWDAQKLRERLDKDTAEEVIEKKIIVSDAKALKQLLVSHGVRASDFNKCVQVQETVNQDALDNLSELGWITKEQIKGAYKVISSKDYIRMTEKKV